MVFFTLEDPRAKVQGSRDPLGLQPIWSRFGRDVVCNLTTVSRAVRGFSVLLLGRYLSEELIDEGVAAEENAIELFLKFEQVAAYARHVNADGATDDIIIGVNRVKKKLAEGNRAVKISERRQDQILTDQKSYGLWGLYSVPARVSGLLKPGPVGLTHVAKEFVEAEYLPQLKPQIRELKKLVFKGGNFVAKARNQPCRALLATLAGEMTSGEKAFFGKTLRDAMEIENERRPAAKRQSDLAILIKKLMGPKDSFNFPLVESLRSEAQKGGRFSLADKLDKILRLEAAIAPAEHVFNCVMAHNGSSVASVAQSICDKWGQNLPNVDGDLSPISPTIELTIEKEQTSHLQRTNNALANGDYREAVNAVIAWNESVMRSRGSSGWVGLKNGKIVVKLRDQNPNLPSPDEPRFSWGNSYFLSSLHDVTFQLEGSDG